MLMEAKNKKSAAAIAVVLLVGLVLGVAILRTEKAKPAGDGHGHSEGAEHAERADEAHHDEKAKDEHGHDHDEHGEEKGHDKAAAPAEFQKGPHGGKLFTKEGFGLELTIFETDVEPEFRIYAYRSGKPVTLNPTTLSVTLLRLGREPEVFRFAAEKDYLKGSAVVEEPHSFAGTVKAQFEGKSYEFKYEQV